MPEETLLKLLPQGFFLMGGGFNRSLLPQPR